MSLRPGSSVGTAEHAAAINHHKTRIRETQKVSFVDAITYWTTEDGFHINGLLSEAFSPLSYPDIQNVLDNMRDVTM